LFAALRLVFHIQCRCDDTIVAPFVAMRVVRLPYIAAANGAVAGANSICARCVFVFCLLFRSPHPQISFPVIQLPFHVYTIDTGRYSLGIFPWSHLFPFNTKSFLQFSNRSLHSVMNLITLLISFLSYVYNLNIPSCFFAALTD